MARHRLPVIEVNGAITSCLNRSTQMNEAIGGHFDTTRLAPDLLAWVHDEGLYVCPINIPLSMFTGRVLCGPAVLSSTHEDEEADDEGWTLPPPMTTELKALYALANRWFEVTSSGFVFDAPRIDMNATPTDAHTQVWTVDEHGNRTRVF